MNQTSPYPQIDEALGLVLDTVIECITVLSKEASEAFIANDTAASQSLLAERRRLDRLQREVAAIRTGKVKVDDAIRPEKPRQRKRGGPSVQIPRLILDFLRDGRERQSWEIRRNAQSAICNILTEDDLRPYGGVAGRACRFSLWLRNALKTLEAEGKIERVSRQVFRLVKGG